MWDKAWGRGRQDRKKTFALSPKDVYVYPLGKKAREVLCWALPQAEPEPSAGDKDKKPKRQGETQDWAKEEFGKAKLNDERLNQRLLIVARDFYDRPQASLPQACQSRKKTKAAYRFFDHGKSTMDTLLASHYDATINRSAAAIALRRVWPLTWWWRGASFIRPSSNARPRMCRARFSLKKPSGKLCIVLSDKTPSLRINRPHLEKPSAW